MKTILKIMKDQVWRKSSAAVFLSMILMGCGNTKLVGTSSSCEANTAQFIVTDGAITRVCGCAEGGGTFITSNSFTCTVNVGTVLYFYFNGITNSHQISAGLLGVTQSFNSESTTKVGSLIATQSGSFNLIDINTSIGGTLVVN